MFKFIMKHPKGALIGFIVGLGLIVVLVVLLILMPAAVILLVVDKIRDNFDDLKDGVKEFWATTFDLEKYDEEALNQWLLDDPDYTAFMYKGLEEALPIIKADDFDPAELQKKTLSDDPEEASEAAFTMAWYDMLRDENLYVDDNDMRTIFQRVIDYNNSMFEYEKIFYEY